MISTVNELEQRLEDILEPLDVAIIGCVVNGPGEAREANIGLTGGSPNLLYLDGKPHHKIENDQLIDELEKVVRNKVAERMNSKGSDQAPITVTVNKSGADNTSSSSQTVPIEKLTG